MKRGRLVGEAILTTPFRAREADALGLTPAEFASIGYYEPTSEAWVPVPTRIDVRRGTMTARITHFSFWDDLLMKVSDVSLQLNQWVGERFGQRAAAPPCTSGHLVPSWAAVVVDSGPELPLRTCAEGTADDRVVVQIVNNRPFGLLLSYGKPVNFGWHQTPAGSASFGTAVVDELVGPNELYLPPLSRASIGMSKSAFGFAEFHAAVTGETLFADALTMAFDGAGGAPGIKAKTMELMAGKVLATCGGFIRPGVDGNATTITGPDSFIEGLGTAAECAGAVVVSLARSGDLDHVRLDKLEARVRVLSALRRGAKVVAVAQLSSSIATMLRDTQFVNLAALASFSVRSKVLPPPTDAPAPEPTEAPKPAPVPVPSNNPAPAPVPPNNPAPAPTPTNNVRGFHIADSFLGGTWARTDPNNGTWYSKGNRPPNGAYWYPNGLGVGVDCARQAASYTVKWADGHTETWNTWFHVTDGKWYPSAATQEVWSNGLQGLRAC